MTDAYFLVTITKRTLLSEYSEYFEKKGVKSLFFALCKGTAVQKTLDYFGLERTDKIVLYSVVRRELKSQLMNELVQDMGINVAGNGIAISIPVDSVGGKTALEYLTEGQPVKEDEMSEQNIGEIPYSLIVVISEKGYSNEVMDAARRAEAKGGTVLHAKGTGADLETFFGLSIGTEKDMIFIVSKRSDKTQIMRSIMDDVGVGTPAHSVVFSLPVDEIAGMKL